MSEEQAILAWQQIVDAKQTVTKYRNALAGDGGGTVDVVDEPGYIWCRYSADQSKVSKVFSMVRGIPEDFPIQVGRRSPDDDFEQVLWIDWTQYQDIVSQETVDNFNTSNHGESHNAASGVDPVPVDLRNIVEMRGRAQDTPDLTISIERGQYIFGYDDVRRYPGETLDLTASVPAVAGHRYVLVYVDGVDNAADSDDGTIVPLAAAPPIPDLTANTIPICLVNLENGQTTITEDDIYDWRFLWDLVSWNAPWLIGTNAERLALTIGDLAELTHFAETDTDQVWQVWEGAWRIVYPPPGLAAPDGDPGTPWTVDNSGELTGSQRLKMDDGVGNSPQIQFIGGSNDDTASLYLVDDAVAGDSDVRLILCDDAGDSELQIYDNDNHEVWRVNTDGETEQSGDLTQSITDAVTNTYTDFQILKHETTGAAAAGFGIRHLWQLEDAGGALEDAAAMVVSWENAGAAAESTLITWYLRKAGAVLGPFIEFGATEVVFNESSADIDFRVESNGETHMLFVDGANDYIGIRESTPSNPLHMYVTDTQFVALFETDQAIGSCIPTFVAYDNTGGSSGGGFLGRLARGTRAAPANVASGDRLGFNIFGGYAGGTFRNVSGFDAWVGTGAIGAASLPSYIRFLTTPNGSVARLERLRIDQDGNILVGTTTSPTANAGKVIAVGDNAADPTMGANTAGFYGKDVGGTVEAFAIDEAGNAAQLTPHNFDGPVQPLPGTLHWSQYHRNPFLGVEKWYDIERALLALEALTGEQFIFTQDLGARERLNWYREQARRGTRKPKPEWMT